MSRHRCAVLTLSSVYLVRLRDCTATSVQLPWRMISTRLIGTLLPFAGLVCGCRGRGPEMYVFKGLRGPAAPSLISPVLPTSYRAYDSGASSALAILLTDTTSSWLGLAHGLKTIGVPFCVTRDYQEALRHRVVLVYPVISGAVLSAKALAALAAAPEHGATLVGFDVLGGGLESLFGFTRAEPSRARYRLKFGIHPVAGLVLSDPRETMTRLGEPSTGPERLGTYGYVGAGAAPVTYEDGTAAVTSRSVGSGHAYAIGLDVGALALTGYDNHDETIARSYVNAYEPAIDVWLRLLKAIYRQGEPDAVTLRTVPQGKSLAVALSHDVDYAGSWANSMQYARFEKSQNIRATYFIQTKYIRDYNDKIFFSDNEIHYLRTLDSLGMELGSHTVSHSRGFAQFPLGSGTEQYPDYHPFVKSRTVTLGGTVFGELRVSKFLLEHFAKDAHVVAFRPGDLADPPSLPEALTSTGYKYSSSVTANSALTQLPFEVNRSHGGSTESGIFDFPVTVEDEALPEMGQRLPQAIVLAKTLARYGGTFVILIHPNILGTKYQFEKGFVAATRPFAWFGAIGDLGKWWAIRNTADVRVSHRGSQKRVVIRTAAPIDGLALDVPDGWKLISTTGGTAVQSGAIVNIGHDDGTITLLFS